MNYTIKKYAGRLGVAIFIYFFFKITSSNTPEDLVNHNLVTVTIFGFTMVVVLSVWEVIDLQIKSFVRKYPSGVISKSRLFKLFLTITFTVLPLMMLFLYFENYYLKDWLHCIDESQMWAVFWSETTKSVLVAWLIVGFLLFQLYMKRTAQIERDREQMQKELLISKYESLKNQLNPHFLFNCYSVLSTLIHQDTQMASEFLDQLSKMYRYILDNDRNQMVSLNQEFKFLESYLFLLKTRHENGIHIEKDIQLDTNQYFVPTLAVQMLIENAVKHNSFCVEHPLMIRIFTENDDYLVVSNVIRKKNSLTHSTKVGLENICKRYNIQSEKQVVVEQDEHLFKVKLPILATIGVL